MLSMPSKGGKKQDPGNHRPINLWGVAPGRMSGAHQSHSITPLHDWAGREKQKSHELR